MARSFIPHFIRKIKIFFGFVIPIFLFGCIQHEQEDSEGITQDSLESEQLVSVKYAKGFKIFEGDGYTKIKTHSFGLNTPFSDSVYIPTSEENAIPAGVKKIEKFESIICQSSTHLAFLNHFNCLDKVSGICGLQYVSNSAYTDELNKSGAVEICLGEEIQDEELLALSPDIFFMYPFRQFVNDDYREKGINRLFIAEYLEKTPLARLEWIRLFGALFNEQNSADAYFQKVEKEYLDLVQEPDTNMKFIMNLPFNDKWYMPNYQSLAVQLIKDAGLTFYYDSLDAISSTENLTLTKEEVWQVGTTVNYWIIIASRPDNFSLEDLKAEEGVYKEFKSVINHQVIFCNTSNSEYFTTGIIEPQVMLKDLLFATHKISDHTPKYFKILE